MCVTFVTLEIEILDTARVGLKILLRHTTGTQLSMPLGCFSGEQVYKAL